MWKHYMLTWNNPNINPKTFPCVINLWLMPAVVWQLVRWQTWTIMRGWTVGYLCTNLLRKRCVTRVGTQDVNSPSGYCCLGDCRCLVGWIICAVAILWSTRVASKSLVSTIPSLHEQSLLVAVPTFLMYSMYALLTIYWGFAVEDQ